MIEKVKPVFGCITCLALCATTAVIAQSSGGTMTAANFNTNSPTGAYQINGINWMFAPGGDTTSVALGPYTLGALTTGTGNLGIGSFVLTGLTTGSNNVAIGYNDLQYPTAATQNVAIGAAVLSSPYESGSLNVGIGYGDLASVTTGFDNVAISVYTMQSLTTGTDNIAIGVSALNGNTTGSFNLGIGTDAQQFGSTGSNNTGVGFQSLRGSPAARLSGSDNTALGVASCANISTGSGNVCIGENGAVTTGGYNIVVGNNLNITTGSANILVGHNLSGTNPSANGQIDVGDAIFGVVGMGMQLARYTVETLPVCSSSTIGMLVYVTDAAAPTYNAPVSGGGSAVLPVFCNGSSWTNH
jgi:hypothetical protein